MPLLPYYESIPELQLAPWIEVLWQSEVVQSGVLRLLPSANAQLLTYSNARGTGLAIVGPMSRFQLTNVRAGNVFMGARLTIGTRIALEGLTVSEMKDSRVFGSALDCPPIQKFEAAFARLDSPDITLLKTLISELAEQRYLRRDQLVDRFIVQALAVDGASTVESLTATLPISSRQFRRRFEVQTGFTPKLFLKVCRQQAAIKQLKQSAGTIATIASAYGYSDQAHFSNEFRKLIGVTPLMLDDELTLQ